MHQILLRSTNEIPAISNAWSSEGRIPPANMCRSDATPTVRPVDRPSNILISEFHLLRGAIVNRTYDTHKNLYVSPFLLTIFGPVNYGPPE